MIKHIKIGKLNITLVLRHRFEKKTSFKRRSFNSQVFRGWVIGLWFKNERMVGLANISAPTEWKNNLVNSYMLGVDLLICRAWINWDFGGAHIEIDN